MKILIANPNSSETVSSSILRSIEKVPFQNDTELVLLTNPKGTKAIDCTFSDYQSSWSLHRAIIERVKQGDIDAVVIAGFGNLGIYGLKEALDIPTLNMSETTMSVAAVLGHKFSILTTLKQFVPAQEDIVQMYGMSQKCASVRAIDVSVTDAVKNREETLERLVNEVNNIVAEDGAEVIILGSGGLSGYNEEVQKRTGVPVLDPGQVTAKFAEYLVSMNLSHSKIRKYAFPPQPIESYY